MKIIDTHAHLDHLKDMDQALSAATEAGVESIIAVSENFASSVKNLEISQRYSSPKIYVAMGMHPSEANQEELEKCKELIYQNQESVIAIGETGLDFWYRWVRKNEEKKQEQREVFQFFLNIAKDLNLPIVIHSRGAWRECFEITRQSGIPKALFHWYSGPEDVLQEILKEGYSISATPSLQYSPEAQAAIKLAPIEKVLIETDTPVYYRNRETNEGFSAEPKDVVKTLELYCGITKVDIASAVEQLNANARAFFNI